MHLPPGALLVYQPLDLCDEDLTVWMDGGFSGTGSDSERVVFMLQVGTYAHCCSCFDSCYYYFDSTWVRWWNAG